MTKEEIVRGNKLIAEFMGYKYYPINEVKDTWHAGWKRNPNASGASKLDAGDKGLPGKCNYLCRNHRGLLFFNDWNWLMLAWIKINELKSENFVIDEMTITSKKSFIKTSDIPYKGRDKSFSSLYMTTDFDIDLITIVWMTIVEFVEWYNTKTMGK